MILEAKYIVPVDGEVIEDGAVAVERGHITAIGPTKDTSGPPATDFGDAVICPGFVNSHTHLELTTLAGHVRPCHDFVDWLHRLMAARGSASDSRERVHQAMHTGLMSSIRAGVTTVGDITASPLWAREALSTSQMRGVSFGEVIAIGQRRHMLRERLDAAADTLGQTERLRIGVSPHAVYTVEPDGMRACAETAHTHGLPLCIHLAESPHEDRFTRSGEGPLADYLSGLGVWDALIPASGCGPVQLAERTGLLGPRTVIAHANYITDEDISLINKAGASVAYCPRTHHAFGHSPHRFRDMLAAGVNVCIGTDSLASNPSLSILDELRFLRERHPDVPPEQIMVMGTLLGAQALGFKEVVGSITVGKSADLVVIPLPRGASRGEWSSILHDTQPPIAVYLSGQPALNESE